MSEQTSNEEMVRRLHADANWIRFRCREEAERIHQAADCLAELDRWKSEALIVLNGVHDSFNRVKPVGLLGQVQSQAMADEILRLRAIFAILPPCPRCGGRMVVPSGSLPSTQQTRCPDCIETPGKAPIERLVKVFEAVQAVRSSGRWVEINGWNTNNPAELLTHLRGIR